MSEAILFMLDVLFMTLLCMGIYRAEIAPIDEKRLGIFLYDDVS